MRKLTLSYPAKKDMQGITDYTREHYGKRQASDYNKVVLKSLEDLRQDPYRPASQDRSDIEPGLRSYHTRHALGRSGTAVKNSRHMVFYYMPQEDHVMVRRVLHDSRDVQRHISAPSKEAQIYSEYVRPKLRGPRPGGKSDSKDKER